MAGFCRFLLKLFGWTVVGSKPRVKQYVIIFAPHTSNWDILVMLLVRSALQLKPRFIGKHTLFIPPVSWMLRGFGGEPVDRRRAQNLVLQIADKFKHDPNYIFALSPEGTRSKRDYWKSGFYRIAELAQVPIQLAFLDTNKKEVGLGPLLYPSGDINRDFDWLRSFYETKKGIKPELLSDIRLKIDAKEKK